MISFIKGRVADIEEDKIIIECNNIGYNVFVPASLIGSIGRTGTEVKLHTYMSVREDAMTLFGFRSKEELNLFKKMISVSGIGPKGALGILSTLTVDNLKLAIMSEDAKAIAKSPGIGAKTASKLILELKDKINMDGIYDGYSDGGMEDSGHSGEGALQKDAADALVSLGYSPSEALNAVRKVCSKNKEISDISAIIKFALKEIG